MIYLKLKTITKVLGILPLHTSLTKVIQVSRFDSLEKKRKKITNLEGNEDEEHITFLILRKINIKKDHH